MKIADRLAELERRRPATPSRIVIITEHDPEPTDATFVIRLVGARFDKEIT